MQLFNRATLHGMHPRPRRVYSAPVMRAAQRVTAGVVVEPVAVDCTVPQAVVSFCGGRHPAVLESSARTAGYGRFSILGSDPVDVLRVREPGACPIDLLARRMAGLPGVESSPPGVPFVGGWIGFFSYESGLGLEGLRPGAPRDLPVPLAEFALYDSAAIFDHHCGRWLIMAVDWPAPFSSTRPTVKQRLEILRTRLTHGSTLACTPPFESPSPVESMEHRCSPPAPGFCGEESAPPGDSRLGTASLSRHVYLARVAEARRHIEAGDIYQVNLSVRFCVPVSEETGTLYGRLRAANPSAFAAFLPRRDYAVLCASPELFLDLRDGRVISRPIKGTAPRTSDPVLDERARGHLASSEKDRAELNMIIDLMRNDLGRVCRIGSVEVKDDGAIEAHPTVFHRVATIAGKLGRGRAWSDLLTATFPGGSITGCPKIRAMQIIGKLEPTRRDVYCGSIGWIGLDGSMKMNIAIRTMLVCGGRAYVYAGGAIVADSVPDAEYEELLAKAAGMFQALNGAKAVHSQPHRELIA